MLTLDFCIFVFIVSSIRPVGFLLMYLIVKERLSSVYAIVSNRSEGQ